MKIVFCYHSLTHHGGVEKILTIKANYLVKEFGYEVYIITYNQQNNSIFFDLDSRIKVIDVSVGDFVPTGNNYIKRQIDYRKYKKILKSKLENELLKINADFAISLGGNEFYVLNSIHSDKSIKIAEYHVTIGAFEVINANLSFFQKIKAQLSFRQFVGNIKKYRNFIVLTGGDKEEWSKFSSNVINIPNPQTFKIDVVSSLSNPIAVAVGRFEPEKQFDHLISVWRGVVDMYPNWKLILKGSGSQKEYFLKLIKEKELQNNVFLESPSHDMEKFYLNASMYLMVSKFEGFSLVMLEAMQSGLPVVSYNCKYGPSELIDDTQNGFIVPFNDKEAIFQKIMYLIENANERKRLGSNSVLKSQNYDLDKIMNTWKLYFEDIKK